MDLGVRLISPRPHHQQANEMLKQIHGKIERLHWSPREEIWNYGGMDDSIEVYNERCLHFSLGINYCKTPMMALYDRNATDDAKTQNPN